MRTARVGGPATALRAAATGLWLCAAALAAAPATGAGQMSGGEGATRPSAGVRVPHPERLERAVERARRMAPLGSLLVSWRGELVVEEYWRGMRPDRPVNLKSVSKTLLSPLVGIALEEGLLEGVGQPVAELLPDYFARLDDPRKADITLHHLLSMTAGLESTSFRNYGEWVASRDWVRDALGRPLVCPPGRCWRYSTGNTHLVSSILARAAGTSLLEYARDRLFEPLGIRIGGWDRDPQGRYLGGNNMALRPKDLLAFGLLHLNGGVWEGRRLVPAEWILASWRPNAASPWNGHRYGYLWWIEDWGGERAYFAWGYGGQYLVLVPRLGLAVVATSSLRGRTRRHTRELREFFDRWLIPAFRKPS